MAYFLYYNRKWLYSSQKLTEKIWENNHTFYILFINNYL